MNSAGEIFNLYPNPASTELLISYRHTYSDNVHIELTDINGRLITRFSEKIIPGEIHIKQININDLNISSGIYFVRIISGNDVSVKKLIIQNR